MSAHYCKDCGSLNTAKLKTCSIDGCTKPHHAKGWCVKHYTRWWRNGHPLRLSSEYERGRL